ncbi:MAG: orotate phosphoribosyltransferase [Clostridiaceae bacterium]|jgi:orotate phosphoribosyltransferase|nr:orotate phosphoribosyltransferase [Clostridiaceae bacterium]
MQETITTLKEANVLQEGHFLLTSGRHSGQYLQCAKIFQDPQLSEKFCKQLANIFQKDNVDTVIGPAIGAIIISYETSRQLGVKNIFTERDANGKMCLRRGFNISKGERFVVVEDVITTGGSVREVIDVVKEAGGEVVGVGCIVDRTGGKIDFGFPFKAVVSVEVVSYEANECPLCKMGVSIEKPGSRK